MPIRLHIDHDVPLAIADYLYTLRDNGAPKYAIETATSLGMTTASDHEHLLAAAQDARVLITRNWRDYYLLHGAWVGWSVALDMGRSHAGILVLSHHASVLQASLALDAFLSNGNLSANELHYYHPRHLWRKY
ncbi:MAG: hypothetical protein M3Y58_05410 [Chloroflexota bacterium]|nr:hypothetical protein [Chloroflexota bacterium]